MSVPSSPRGRQRVPTADQHRRMASLLRLGTAPGREERARHHEQIAEEIERRAQWSADIQRPPTARMVIYQTDVATAPRYATCRLSRVRARIWQTMWNSF